MTGPISPNRFLGSLKEAAAWPGAHRTTVVILATAWYWPLEREGLAPPEFQPPGALVASALETSLFEELKM